MGGKTWYFYCNLFSFTVTWVIFMGVIVVLLEFIDFHFPLLDLRQQKKKNLLPAVRMDSVPQNKGILSSLNNKTGKKKKKSTNFFTKSRLRGQQWHVAAGEVATVADVPRCIRNSSPVRFLFIHSYTRYRSAIVCWLFIGFQGQKCRKSPTEETHEADWLK